jgi:hypothetical protein
MGEPVCAWCGYPQAWHQKHPDSTVHIGLFCLVRAHHSTYERAHFFPLMLAESGHG